MTAPDPADRWDTVAARLERTYGRPRLGNRRSPLDELVFIVLSAQTEEYNYRRTYRALRRRFRTWDRVRRALPEAVAAQIRLGGLAAKKAGQIQAILGATLNGPWADELRELSALPDAEAEQALVSLPGVGIKTAKCVLLFALDRCVLPVDTHVWRVANRLRGTPLTRKPTDAEQRALESDVRADLRYLIHVGLVSHGRRVCRARAPRCDDCVLRDLCRSAPAFFDSRFDLDRPSRSATAPATGRTTRAAEEPAPSGLLSARRRVAAPRDSQILAL